MSVTHQTGSVLLYLFGMVVHHARRVIDGQTNLILAFTGLGPSKPNLVFPKLTSNVWNDLPHVQPLPSAIVSSMKFTQMGPRLVSNCSSSGNFFKNKIML